MKPVSRVRKALDWTLGLSLIGVGVVGLVLPGLQGILMILAGLAILSSHSPLARRMNEMVKEKARRARDRWRHRGGRSGPDGDGAG